METFISIIKRVTSLFFIVIFICAEYFFLFLKGDAGKLPSSLSGGEKASSTVSSISSEEEIIKLQQTLYELERTNINSDFFKTNIFKSLKNFKQKIPTVEQSRENPFAPIGE